MTDLTDEAVKAITLPVAWKYRWKIDGEYVGWRYSDASNFHLSLDGYQEEPLYSAEALAQARADTEAAVALALEAAARLLDNRVEQLVADYGSYESDANVTNLPEWVETAEEELEPLAAAIRALVPASALAKLAKLRTERDEWKAVSETLSEMQAGEYKRAEALAAENAELRAAIAAKDAEISVSRQLWEKQDAAKDAERDRLAAAKGADVLASLDALQAHASEHFALEDQELRQMRDGMSETVHQATAT